MSDELYKGTLEAARDEMDGLLKEESEISARLVVIRQQGRQQRRKGIGQLLLYRLQQGDAPCFVARRKILLAAGKANQCGSDRLRALPMAGEIDAGLARGGSRGIARQQRVGDLPVMRLPAVRPS